MFGLLMEYQIWGYMYANAAWLSLVPFYDGQ